MPKGTLYVVSEAAPADSYARTIVPGSAIVGSGENGFGTEWEIVYYEGNLYNAVNQMRYCERCASAYGRMSVRYPSVARMLIPPEHLTQIGEWDADQDCVRLTSDDHRESLRLWLCVATIQQEELVLQRYRRSAR